ncbi:MAG TPA: glycosyltransferase family 4 protein [Novosphingobium sp.]|nr:glycosyltransferase family 4 protein [Novosphingobium sp.]
MLAPPRAQPLRILIYTNADRSEAGGVQSVVRSLGPYLCAQGFAVQTGWSHDHRSKERGDAEWVSNFHVRSGGRRWLHVPSMVNAAVELGRFRPDVVNVHYAAPSTLYFLSLRQVFGFRLLLSCHGSDILRPLPYDAPHIPSLIAAADGITAVSQDLFRRIAAHAPAGSLHYLPNGVDTTFWHRPGPGISPKPDLPRLIVGVGRLEKVKGFDLLLDAFALLARDGREFRLTIVGDGSQRAALESRAAELGIREQVEFAGVQPRERIRALFHSAHAFVLSSRSEGTPLALLEAMACALPCVATRVGGVPSAGGDGVLLVEPEDAAALARAIGTVLADEAAANALSKAAQRQAAKFSPEKTLALYKDLLCSLAHKRRPISLQPWQLEA